MVFWIGTDAAEMKINVCYYVTDCKVLRKAEVTLEFLKIST